MKRNLLVVSDVHLGCDLVQHMRPETPVRTPGSVRRDEELCSLLDWYRHHSQPGSAWRLIIAGDFIDFSGMALSAYDVCNATEDERCFGLGASERNSVTKMRLVAITHAAVFAALTRFVEAGNDIVVVRGNHDVDLFWPGVQREFRKALDVHAGVGRSSLGGRVEFLDWFYYEPGRIYVEHGHHYDEYCTHPFPLAPLDPRCGSTLARSLSDVLKRYIVNPTRGLTEGGHEGATMIDYLRFAARLGLGNCVRLVGRYATTIGRAAAHALQHQADIVAQLRSQQRNLLIALAQRHDMELSELEPLCRAWKRPGTRSIASLFACLMVDRLLLAFALLAIAGLVVRVAGTGIPALLSLAALGVVGTLMMIWMAHTRGSVDSGDSLRGAASLATRRLNTPLVVMGHTHAPEVTTLATGAEYINLGGWVETEASEGLAVAEASRTHLVVTADGNSATLYAWDRNTRREFRPAKARVEATQHAPSERPAVEVALGYPMGA